MPLTVRPITEEEWPKFRAVDHAAFGYPSVPDEVEGQLPGYPFERTVATFDGDEIIGTAADYPFELTLPGLTTTPAAGVTWVGVLPTSRRRGVLSGMMRYQLDAVHERGEAVAILLASESTIYGRFGYGLATTQSDYTLERVHSAPLRAHKGPGRIRLIDKDVAVKELPRIHERSRRTHVGEVARTEGWWEGWFRGKGRFYALYESKQGTADGYAAYKVEFGDGSGRKTKLNLQSLVAVTDDAYLGLWQFVTDIDLTEVIEVHNRPTDEALRWLLADPRRLEVTRTKDFLWSRLVDLAAALKARRYAADDRIVFEVADPFCPWNEGRWLLDGGPAGASAKRVRTKPDIALSAADLGAIYLGAHSLAPLAKAGRVEEKTKGASGPRGSHVPHQPSPLVRHPLLMGWLEDDD